MGRNRESRTGIAVLAFIVASATAQFNSPAGVRGDCADKIDGIYPTEHCSTYFLECSGGTTTKQSCAVGLWFNPNSSQCDYRENIVSCQDPFSCVGREDGVYGEGCSSMFWFCTGGQLKHTMCPDGLFFNVDAQICDFRENIRGCGGSSISYFTQTTRSNRLTFASSTTAPDTITKLSTQSMRDPTEVPYGQTYPTYAPRQRISGTMSKTPLSESTAGTACAGKEDGPHAIEKCSGQYVLCWAGTGEVMKCPKELKFNEANESCDYPLNVAGCNISPPASFDENSYSSASSDTPSVSLPIPRQPADFDCSSRSDGLYSRGCIGEFYQCVAGVTYHQKCPEGLVFDDLTKGCDYPQICSSPHSTLVQDSSIPTYSLTPSTTMTTVVPSLSLFDCSSRADGLYSEGCVSSYFHCASGVAYPFSCPTGLVFDGVSQSCNYLTSCGQPRPLEEESVYKETQSVPSSLDGSNRETTFDCTDKEDGVYGPSCAHHFVNCVSGMAISQTCPVGLVFHKRTGSCDYPERCSKEEDAVEVAIVASPTSQAVEPTLTPSDIDCFNREDGMYSSGCTRVYVQCASGMAFNRVCTEGLVFVQDTGRCDYATNCGIVSVDESVRSDGYAPTVSSHNPSPAQEIPVAMTSTPPKGDEPSGVLIDCTTLHDGSYTSGCTHAFVQCVSGAAFPLECPAGLIFDKRMNKCVWPEECSSDETIDLPTVSIPTRSSDVVSTVYDMKEEKEEMVTDAPLPQMSNDGVLCTGTGRRTMGKCSSGFVQCIGGKLIARRCPGQSLFDEKIGLCVYDLEGCELDVDVVDVTSQETSESSTETPQQDDISTVYGTPRPVQAAPSYPQTAPSYPQTAPSYSLPSNSQSPQSYPQQYYQSGYDIQHSNGYQVPPTQTYSTGYEPPAQDSQYQRANVYQSMGYESVPQSSVYSLFGDSDIRSKTGSSECDIGSFRRVSACSSSFHICSPTARQWIKKICGKSHRFDSSVSRCRPIFEIRECDEPMSSYVPPPVQSEVPAVYPNPASSFEYGVPLSGREYKEKYVVDPFKGGYQSGRLGWNPFVAVGNTGSFYTDDGSRWVGSAWSEGGKIRGGRKYHKRMHDSHYGNYVIVSGNPFGASRNRRLNDEWDGRKQYDGPVRSNLIGRRNRVRNVQDEFKGDISRFAPPLSVVNPFAVKRGDGHRRRRRKNCRRNRHERREEWDEDCDDRTEMTDLERPTANTLTEMVNEEEKGMMVEEKEPIEEIEENEAILEASDSTEIAVDSERDENELEDSETSPEMTDGIENEGEKKTEVNEEDGNGDDDEEKENDENIQEKTDEEKNEVEEFEDGEDADENKEIADPEENEDEKIVEDEGKEDENDETMENEGVVNEDNNELEDEATEVDSKWEDESGVEGENEEEIEKKVENEINESEDNGQDEEQTSETENIEQSEVNGMENENEEEVEGETVDDETSWKEGEEETEDTENEDVKDENINGDTENEEETEVEESEDGEDVEENDGVVDPEDNGKTEERIMDSEETEKVDENEGIIGPVENAKNDENGAINPVDNEETEENKDGVEKLDENDVDEELKDDGEAEGEENEDKKEMENEGVIDPVENVNNDENGAINPVDNDETEENRDGVEKLDENDVEEELKDDGEAEGEENEDKKEMENEGVIDPVENVNNDENGAIYPVDNDETEENEDEMEEEKGDDVESPESLENEERRQGEAIIEMKFTPNVTKTEEKTPEELAEEEFKGEDENAEEIDEEGEEQIDNEETSENEEDNEDDNMSRRRRRSIVYDTPDHTRPTITRRLSITRSSRLHRSRFSRLCVSSNPGQAISIGQCRQDFVYCKNARRPVVAACPVGDLFDALMSTCVPTEICGAEKTKMNIPAAPTSVPHVGEGENPTMPTRTETITQTTGKRDDSDCSSLSDGAYPLAECSSDYFVCSSSVKHVYKCPGDTVYDKKNDRCEWPAEVPACGGSPTKSTSSPVRDTIKNEYSSEAVKRDSLATTVSPMHVHFDCINDGGFAIDCKGGFIMCSNGMSSFMKCSHGLVFEEATQSCQYPAHVGSCGLTPVSSLDSTASPIYNPSTRSFPSTTSAPVRAVEVLVNTPVDKNACRGISSGLEGATRECPSSFVICKDGEVTGVMNCPEGTFFDERSKNCDYREVACTGGWSGEAHGVETPLEQDSTVKITEEGGEGEEYSRRSSRPYRPMMPVVVEKIEKNEKMEKKEQTVTIELIGKKEVKRDDSIMEKKEQTVTIELIGKNEVKRDDIIMENKPVIIASSVEPSLGANCDWKGAASSGPCSPQFIICSNGKPQVFDCSANLIFSSSTSACEYSEFVPGCPQYIKENVVSTSTVAPVSSVSPVSHSMVMDEAVSEYTRDEIASTTTMRSLVPLNNDEHTSAQFEATGDHCTFLADRPSFPLNYCSMTYAVCTAQGLAYKTNCTFGYLFDSVIRRCVPSEHCGQAYLKDMAGAPPTSSPIHSLDWTVQDSRCVGAKDGSVKAISLCSGQYVRCEKETVVMETCSGVARVFSPTTGRCVLQVQMAECSTSSRGSSPAITRPKTVIPSMPSSDVVASPSYSTPVSPPSHRGSRIRGGLPIVSSPSQFDASTFCTTKHTDGLYRNPENCAGIVQCFGGEAFSYPSCAPGLFFNEIESQCDYSSNVPECASQADPIALTDSSASCKGQLHGAHLADDSDCSIYYRCVWGSLERLSCPDGTVFNPRLSVCDYPSEVPHCQK